MMRSVGACGPGSMGALASLVTPPARTRCHPHEAAHPALGARGRIPHPIPPMPMIEAGASTDGALTYFIQCAPSCLPPVLKRDLLLAWDAARAAALARARPGLPRA